MMLAICSLWLILLMFTTANWYFEVTKVIDQEIPNYVYQNTCLKNAGGSSNDLILSSFQLLCDPLDQILSVLIIWEQEENNYFLCFKLNLLSQISSWSVHMKPP